MGSAFTYSLFFNLSTSTKLVTINEPPIRLQMGGFSFSEGESYFCLISFESSGWLVELRQKLSFLLYDIGNMCGFNSLFVHRDHIMVGLVFDCNRGSLGGESDIGTFLMCWTEKRFF